MVFTRTQIGIAVGAGALLVFVFLGYLWWLSNQGPVLARSEEHDPLSGLPMTISMNPLRDRSTEQAASKFLREMRDGHCDDLLTQWEHDYRKKYAHYICQSETQHPLVSWQLVEWEEAPPLIILHYRGKRRNAPDKPGAYKELFTVTTEKKAGEWVVTKYDAMY
jgi:transposase InsO family protein